MKKKNWLMTLAFAVMALTIVSTCVIGSTYAKFTMNVSGGAAAKAAGFYVSGSAASDADLKAAADMIAPGGHTTVNTTITYFSQVDTVITATAPTVTGYGALATTWSSILNDYDGADKTTVASTYDSIDKVFVVTVGTTGSTVAALAEDFAALVRTAGTLEKVGTTNGSITGMAANATAALSITVPVTITWTQVSDAFDTYLGNLIYTYATTAANSSAPNSGVVVGLPLNAAQIV